MSILGPCDECGKSVFSDGMFVKEKRVYVHMRCYVTWAKRELGRIYVLEDDVLRFIDSKPKAIIPKTREVRCSFAPLNWIVWVAALLLLGLLAWKAGLDH